MEKEHFKIWGLEFDQWFDGYKYHWETVIHEPFWYLGNKVIGINEKTLGVANMRGVDKIEVKLPDKVVEVGLPTKADLKELIKNKRFEDKKSLFPNGQPMRIYYIKY